MHNNSLALIFTFILSITLCSAQTTLSQIDKDALFSQGKELFRKEKYGAAREVLEKYVSTNPSVLKKTEADYYIAISAMNLYHKDGENKLDNFIALNPDHPKSVEAYYEMGLFYFRDKKYSKSVKYLSKADLSKLDVSKQLEAKFKLGYANFNLRDFKKALEYFNEVKRSNSDYSPASYYYSGYISYREEEYDQALFDFKKAEEDAGFSKVVPYMIVNMFYRQERYDELIDYGESVIKKKVNNKNQIQLLIGDAYYIREDYSNAGRNYAYYMEGNKKPLSRDVKYRVAYTYYKNGDSNKAIEQFIGLTLKTDSIGQFSGYYLGELYLSEGNKESAASAFLRSGQSEYNKQIQQQSLFQYSKVSFELERYIETITYLEPLKNELKGKQLNEANEILGEAYLNSSNYEQAYNHFRKISTPSASTRKSFQRVAYLRASNFYNDQKYAEAVEGFKESLETIEDQELAYAANYWLGECYFTGRKFEESVAYYKKALLSNGEYGLKASYGLGYAYYNTKKFNEALVQFKYFIENQPQEEGSEFYGDALIRVADCYYVNKEYSKALSNYTLAQSIQKRNLDYCYYQKGLIYGIQNELPSAKTNLRKLIAEYPRSGYVDNAIFQIANLEFESGNYQQAIQGFNQMIQRYPKSNLVPFALLKKGIANANFGQHDAAVKDYKKLLSTHGTHSTASAGLLGLQEALAILNRTSEFEPFLTQFKQQNPDDKDIANIEFETAKSLYFNQNYSSAVNSFLNYLNSHTNNQFSYEARYYLADSYYRLNELGNAKKYFKKVIEDNATNRINRAIQKVAEIESSSENYLEAIKYYSMLRDRSSNKKEKFRSYEGLMLDFYSAANFDSSAFYAERILELGGVSSNSVNEAQLYLGKSAYAKGDLTTASDEFLNTLNTAKDRNGAEAQFMIAKILYDQQKYPLSNETLFDLNKNFGSYLDWVGEGFLLIADNYVNMDEMFQAQATLQSIIDNFPEEDIVQRAEQKLMELTSNLEEVEESDTIDNYEVIKE